MALGGRSKENDIKIYRRDIGTNRSYTGAYCPGIVSNRPKGLDFCIDDSLSSKNSLRTVRLSAAGLSRSQLHLKTRQNPLYFYNAKQKSAFFFTSLASGFWRVFRSSWDLVSLAALNRTVLNEFLELSESSIHLANASGRFLSISDEFSGDYRLLVGDYAR